LFFDGTGRLYYTLSGQTGLYSRQFSPDSGIVHNLRQTAGTLADAGGAFRSGDFLYYVLRTSGNLSRVGWLNGAPSGVATVVSGPALDGVDWRARAVFLGPTVLPNVPPTAGVAVSCTALACSANGGSSTDSDGTITSYAWSWGDGTASTGPTATHSYAAAGTYPVTLTVTDDHGATGSATQSVTVAPPAASPIGFRGTAGVNANTNRPTLTVPAGVQAGDALALLVSTKTGTTHSPPTGWTARGQSSGTALLTTVWSKVATAGDAGAALPVTLSELTKVDVRLLAYSGTAATDPVSAVVATDPVATTSHPAPAVTLDTPGSWVVWHWADKSAATTTWWTAPAGLIARGTAIGTGTTYLSSLSADGGTSSAIGTVPGPTAVTNAASRGNGVAIVLRPLG
jgi:PKD repeat protein